jgi:hypothetical protein
MAIDMIIPWLNIMDQKINWTRECLDKMDKMKTFKEKCKYWNVNMYRMSRSEVEALPFDIQDRYIQSYVRYILYKTWIPALIVFVYFSVVITIAFLHFFG